MHLRDQNKPHRCQVCGRGFARLSNCKDHLATHASGPDAFRCRRQGCQQEFADRSRRRTHEKSAHEEEAYVAL